jgi:hypothetical protein
MNDEFLVVYYLSTAFTFCQVMPTILRVLR